MLVKGFVKDENGKAIANAGVQILANLSIGKATNQNGYFEIEVPNNSVLRFTMLGFYIKELPAKSTMNVVLETDETLIEPVEIVGTTPTNKKTNWGLIVFLTTAGLALAYGMSNKKETEKIKKPALKQPATPPRKVTL